MTKKILIVEDDKDIASTMLELLELEGYKVDMALDGRLALQSLEQMAILPDLILLDFSMPNMDGPTFRAEQLKLKRLASIPVMLMTADGAPEAKQRQIGGVGYVKKPVDIEKFLMAIKKVLS